MRSHMNYQIRKSAFIFLRSRTRKLTMEWRLDNSTVAAFVTRSPASAGADPTQLTVEAKQDAASEYIFQRCVPAFRVSIMRVYHC